MPTCLVCGESCFEPHLEVLLRCEQCGFVTANLEVPPSVQKLYDGDYFTGGEYLNYAADEAFFKRNFRKRLAEIIRRCGQGRLLEIGSAYGFFLDLARRRFEVIGFEPNQQAARFAREHFGVDVRTSNFLDTVLADLGGRVDVTVMWDVIEHLERPDHFLAKIADCSQSGSLLYITTGDIGSRLATWRGGKWRMIHPPTHLHYFDRTTITRLLQRHGFSVLDIRSIGTARSFRQILYSIFALHLRSMRTYNVLSRMVPSHWGVTLNTFDIMQVTACRQ